MSRGKAASLAAFWYSARMEQAVSKIIHDLQKMGNDKHKAGMGRFGINTKRAFGISVTELRKYGRSYRKKHELALALWATGWHEARILAVIIDDPAQVTAKQMDEWVKDFDSWDVCDQACTGLFDKTPYAVTKAVEWSDREPEFEKRAGFALMAGLAWHSKTEPDETFLAFLPLIEKEAIDDRNFVKKSVNWALREIGKRNRALYSRAIETAQRIKIMDSPSARWIASNALRELLSRGSK